LPCVLYDEVEEGKVVRVSLNANGQGRLNLELSQQASFACQDDRKPSEYACSSSRCKSRDLFQHAQMLLRRRVRFTWHVGDSATRAAVASRKRPCGTEARCNREAPDEAAKQEFPSARDPQVAGPW